MNNTKAMLLIGGGTLGILGALLLPSFWWIGVPVILVAAIMVFMTKHQPKPTRTPPPVTPGTPHLQAVVDVGSTPATWVRPPVSVRVDDGGLRRLGSDRDVQPLVRVPPEYPARLIGRGVEGWVKLQFTITAAGSVQDAFVVDASPQTVFDDAALKAIARWRYNPRVENGAAVERVGMQTVIRFELANGS